MIIVFEGHDLSGKTTLAQQLAKELNKCYYVKNFHKPKEGSRSTPNELISSYYHLYFMHSTLQKTKELKDSYLIVDRFFISEWVYGQAIRGYNGSTDLRMLALNTRASMEDALLVVVEANDNSVKERAESRGEDFVTLDQVKTIRALYRKYYHLATFNKKMLINNDKPSDLSKNIKYIKAYLDEQ